MTIAILPWTYISLIVSTCKFRRMHTVHPRPANHSRAQLLEMKLSWRNYDFTVETQWWTGSRKVHPDINSMIPCGNDIAYFPPIMRTCYRHGVSWHMAFPFTIETLATKHNPKSLHDRGIVELININSSPHKEPTDMHVDAIHALDLWP